MKKWVPFVLVIVLGALVLIIKNCTADNKAKQSTSKTTTPKKQSQAPTVNRDHGFDRRISYLEYSKHAKCRMDCRKITQAEVEEIMQEGKINYNKSDLKNTRCPRYALEGTTNDNQRVRIVFAQCNESTTVVTVIDLETEFSCDCPGDDNKYKNRN